MKPAFIRAAVAVLIWLMGAVSLAQAQVATTTTISVAPNPAKQGTPFTITVNVSAAAPHQVQGGITLYRDGDYFWQSGVSGNTDIVFPYDPAIYGVLPIGTTAWTVEFTGTQYGFSNSNAGTSLTISGIATTATLQVAPAGPVTQGTTVTLTANVTAGSGTPTGTVNFKDDNTTIGSVALVNGMASFQTATLLPGLHALSAEFVGDGNFVNARTNPQNLQVNESGSGPVDTTTTVTTSPAPTIFGQAFDLVATVTSPNNQATGEVFFYVDNVYAGSGVVSSGTSTFRLEPGVLSSMPAIGNHTVRAQYAGDVNHNGSTSADHTHVVESVPATIALTRSPDRSTLVGQTVQLTARVTGNVAYLPTGLVDFYSGTSLIGQQPLTNGVAAISTTTLHAKTHALTARYRGNASYAPITSSTLAHSVFSTKATPTVTVTSSTGGSSVAGQMVEFSAQVNRGATGTVTFRRGTSILRTVPLVGGVAKYQTGALPLGTSSITARYNGNATLNAVTSAALSHVRKAATRTTLGRLPKLVLPDDTVKMTATVAKVTTSSKPLTGRVAFMRGTTTIRVEELVNGRATLSTKLPIGQHDITAVYSGDGTFGRSDSDEQLVEVGYAYGSEFRVSVATHFDQKKPSVSALDDHAVAVWMGQTSATGNYGIFARLFNEGGLPDGGEIQVAAPAPNIDNPVVSKFGNTRYAVVWEAPGPTGATGQDIFVRLFDSSVPLNNSPIRVNTLTDGHQKYPRAFYVDGRLVIVWHSYDAEDRSDIYARIYDTNGNPLAAEFRVHDAYPTESAWNATGTRIFGSRFGLPADTGFAIGWMKGMTGLSATPMVQRFDVNGQRIGNAVELTTPAPMFDITLIGLPAELVVAAWTEMQKTNGVYTDTDVRTRILDGNNLLPIMSVRAGNYTNDVGPAFGKLGSYTQNVYGRALAFLTSPRAVQKRRVMAQAYGKFGPLMATPFLLDSGKGRNVSELVATDLGRGWQTLVLWNSDFQDGDRGGIFGRLIATP